MKSVFSLLFILFIITSCSSPNITAIAKELCQCKSLSPQEAEKCFLKWEDKYGKVSLTESQRITFDEIVVECMTTK